ncbi:bacterial translation initiation factor 2 (bIF-2) [Pseudopedobacter saltans DSM 12145]|uniref:Translation initiation factor IF-2 n=1 Tax=Pseudopedobacter saltans (strain ATCC 51119 / DSM 12145 / JCM 21818 / CCUG 39354 / LMG 10337 / NBRC 100064 / NCIMB 13643) TaxID=762903 RepID=F0S7U6_PSESL|nr:translation initiation factor IF-2 [Pseudopedobacter saltans]ADY53351.1 bacterial translation initiation factor 2 (bIF-2) [Pseudopedobacter saltans DSM 12145]
MSEDKKLGILKVAKELNIGIGTIAEFLDTKGFKIEAKPNTKLTDEMYSALLKEYQGDKILKEEAKNIVIGKIRRDDAPHHQTQQPAQSEKKEAEKEDKEILIKNATAEDLPKEEVSVKEVAEPEIKKDEPTAPHTGVKIVGKIDLDSLNSKTRPDKKQHKEEEKKEIEKPRVEEPKKVEEKAPVAKAPEEVKAPVKAVEVEEKPQSQKQEPVNPIAEKPPVQEKKEEKSIPASPEVSKAEKPVSPSTEEDKGEDEVIRARAQQLSGPKIIGKIQLPVNKKKDQPVASSSNPNAAGDNKRKRKRKPSDGNPHHNHPQQGGNRPAGAGGQNPQQGQGGGGRPQGQGGGQHHQNIGNRNNDRGGNRPHHQHKKGGHHQPAAPKAEPTEKEIQDQIKATLARLSGAGKSGKFAQRSKLRRQNRDRAHAHAEEAALEQELQSKILKVTEFVTANELANMMDVSVTDVISTCMSLGMFVSINQRLDAETLTIVADEFGYEIQFVGTEEEEQYNLVEEDKEEDLQPRSPIVTVMGHVDHGKTSLLDFVRKANVTSGEAGGITQHIGAYEVVVQGGKKITFLDTPGHEAFTAMRARGAKVTDVAIIVIAADDSVMPQTVEAINHAQAANLPIVFAFNKIDKPGANTDRIREQLAAMNILVEEWGGKYQTQEIAAKSGLNIDKLLEKVLLEAELLDLKANPNKRAVGTVIEAQLDKGRGYVATVLVEEGTLRVGDPILAGSYSGRVKALFNERGGKVEKAGPSTPVQVLGFQGAPQAGDRFNAVEGEAEARNIANKRLQLQREQGLRTQKHITLDEIGRRLAIGNFKELNIIIKGDVDGSVEALSDSLQKLSTEEIVVKIVHKGVGQISESDVLLATASDAIIIGFQVRPSASARKLAENEQIDIRLYSVIYKAIEEIKAAMEGMLAPEFEEKIVANVEIRETFKISKVGTIAGCMVLEGTIHRNNEIRIVRDGVVIHTGTLESLKRFKDDVKEVNRGYECGLNIKGFNDIQVGDIVEAFEQVEIKRKL